MAWTFKKKEEAKKPEEKSQLPSLPRLPELSPPPTKTNMSSPSISQLPSFPTNSLGEKFSQDTIKKAITGKKEDEKVFEANDFGDEEFENRMMQKPLKSPRTQELSFKEKEFAEMAKGSFEESPKMIRKAEPVFIRIDKFEESLDTLEAIQKKVMELEHVLRKIQKIKEEEGTELESWENEIKNMKNQIEKIDKDVFSKIE